MKKYGLVGQNLTYSYSKIIHEYLGHKLGRELSYELIAVDSLDDVELDKYDGLNVTIPYKSAIISKLSSTCQFSKEINSCNTINNQKKGFNTDKDGFEYLLKQLIGDKTKLNRVVILGDSNSSRMIKAVLKTVDVITISRTKKAEADFFTYADETEIYGDLLINTTPIGQGIKLEKSPLKEELVKNFSFVLDLNYNPNINPLLNIAAKNNIPNVNGLMMLVVQAIKAFQIWEEIEVADELYKSTYNYVNKLVNPKLAIIGMPYAGKTFYGKKLEAKGKVVIDLDEEISKQTNLANSEYIQKYGITAFRQIETKVLKQVVTKKYDVIILGGGIIENFDNRLVLKNHRIEYLERDFDTLAKNFKKANLNNEEIRPLTNDLENLRQVYNRRKLIYPFFQNIEI